MAQLPTELALTAYRPRQGEAELLAHLVGEVATLRRRGHVTERAVPVARTEAGELLLVIEWSSPHAVDDAHADPDVVSLWRRKDELAEYLPPAALAGSGVPFARWPLVATL